MKPILNKGQLKTWKDDRGFGFIQPANGSQEIFLHISEIKDYTRRPKVGDTIYYYAVTEDGKVSAHKAFISGARRKPTLSSSRNKAAFRDMSLSPFPVLETLLLSILPLAGSLHFVWVTANPLPLILYPVMGLVTFALYADDKSREKQGSWRTPEKTLHLCELAGGWLGGFVASEDSTTKSSKESYQFEFWVIVALHYIAWLGWLFFGRFITT